MCAAIQQRVGSMVTKQCECCTRPLVNAQQVGTLGDDGRDGAEAQASSRQCKRAWFSISNVIESDENGGQGRGGSAAGARITTNCAVAAKRCVRSRVRNVDVCPRTQSFVCALVEMKVPRDILQKFLEPHANRCKGSNKGEMLARQEWGRKAGRSQ